MKRTKKRNIIEKCARCILALCIVFVSVNMMLCGNVYAADMAGKASLSDGNVFADNFDLNCYWADWCLNPESISYKSIEFFKQFEIPSQILVDIADKDAVFQWSVNAWKSANYAVDPSKSAQDALDEKGYYEAIIFSVFMIQTSSEQYGYELVKKVSAETNKLCSMISGWVKNTDGIDKKMDIKNGKIKDLSAGDQKAVRKYLEDTFSKEHPALNGIDKINEAIDTVFETTDTLAGAVGKLASFLSLSEASEGIKNLLRQMSEMCPNTNECMKEALTEAAVSAENAISGLALTMWDASAEMTVAVVGDFFDEWWHDVLKANPYSGAFLIGAKMGTFISNTLFSTDRSIEQYVKMKCLGEFFSLLTDVRDDMEITYKNFKSVQNAKDYLEAVQAMYTAGKLSCDFAISYADIVYEDAAMSALMPKDNYYKFVKLVNERKEILYIRGEKTFQTDYKDQLQFDYPEIYDVYFNGNWETEEVDGKENSHRKNVKLKFKIKTYKYSAKNNNGDVYGTISYQYPVAQGNSKVAQVINRYFKSERVKAIKSKKDSYKEWLGYSDISDCKVTCNNGIYVSVLRSGFVDADGFMHGSMYRDSVIFDAKTGKKITPKKILGVSKKTLNKKVINLYLKKYDKTYGKDDFPFIVERNEVQGHLSDENFNSQCYFKDGKLYFYVYPYTIGSFGAGFIEVSIKLKP